MENKTTFTKHGLSSPAETLVKCYSLLGFSCTETNCKRTKSFLAKRYQVFQNIWDVLIPVCPLPIVSLLCGRLDEEGIRGEGVKVDQRCLLFPTAVCDHFSWRLHILEQGNSPAGGPRAGAPGSGQQTLKGTHLDLLLWEQPQWQM